MSSTIKRRQRVYIQVAGVFGRVIGIQRKTGLVHVKTEKGPSSSGLTWMFGATELTVVAA